MGFGHNVENRCLRRMRSKETLRFNWPAVKRHRRRRAGNCADFCVMRRGTAILAVFPHGLEVHATEFRADTAEDAGYAGQEKGFAVESTRRMSKRPVHSPPPLPASCPAPRLSIKLAQLSRLPLLTPAGSSFPTKTTMESTGYCQ
jgi:hypothetical protein